MEKTRRQFLEASLGTGGALVVGCSDDGVAAGPETDAQGGSGAGGSGSTAGVGGDAGAGKGGQGGASGSGCEDAVAGGEYLGNAEFIGETAPLNTPFNRGLDGRLYTDLSAVTRDEPLIPNENFYVRTREPDQIDRATAWRIAVDGLVDVESELTLADLEPLTKPMGAHVLECSGNGRGGSFGLLSAAEWSGAPLEDVLGSLGVSDGATQVLVTGFDEHSQPSVGNHSTPGASWIFSLAQIAETGAFLATEMNGEPLPVDHGSPVRLYVPNWYGCSNIKWVNRITLVGDTEPATGQMREFASRTHQIGVPSLAKDYRPASMDQTAMPIAFEKWKVDGQILYRVVGIMWGGYELTDALSIQYGSADYAPVDICPKQTTNSTWTVWTHIWRPPAVGDYRVRLRVDDPTITTKRLDTGFYLREVQITEV
jgi:DMSO/TMAO reductase YedYZ molybdopterin-dependent catalytic subunit